MQSIVEELLVQNSRGRGTTSMHDNNTVDSFLSQQSRDMISTVLCDSVRFKSRNDQCGATVEIESRDCQDMRDSTVMTITARGEKCGLALPITSSCFPIPK